MASHAPITGAQTRAPLFPVPILGGSEPHLHLTDTPPRVASRRDLLAFAGAATALGAAVATGATVVAAEAFAAPPRGPSPFDRALARYEAAEAYFERLSGLTNAEWTEAEAVYHREFDAMLALRPADTREFMMLFVVAARIGQLGTGDSMCDAMIADAKRLMGAA